MTNYHNGVVILNYNTEDDTVKCIDSIRKYATEDKINKIYIVDNASPDGSGERLKTAYACDDEIVVIISDRNGGFSQGNNQGIRQAIKDGCKNVFIINSDIVLLNDAIGIMAKELDNRKDIAAVGPRVYNKAGNDIQFARKALTYKNHILERMPFIGDRQVRRYSYDKTNDFCFDGMFSGCCVGLKTEYLSEATPLDDNVFMYYEEDILAYRMKAYDKKAYICSQARVLHNEASSTRKSIADKEVFERYHRWLSAMYVIKEYSGASDTQIHALMRINIKEWHVLELLNSKYKRFSDAFCQRIKDIADENE